MANKPVSGSIYYDSSADRPRVDLRVGSRKVLVEGDAGGGSITLIDSPDGSVIVTNPAGATVSVEANFGTGANTVTEGNDARLSDARTPTGAAGGDLGGTYPNPTVEALGTSGAAVNVGAAAPPTLGQQLIATSATTATWQTSSAIVLGSRITKPVTPDSRDEEFDSSTTISSAFNWYNASGALVGAPVKTALAVSIPAPNDNRYQLHTDRRPGWLGFQHAIGGVNGSAYLMKQVTLGTDDTVWTRVNIPQYPKNAAGTNVGLALCLAVSKAGPLPDIGQNMLLCGIFHSGGAGESSFEFSKYVAGVGTAVPIGTPDSKQYTAEYLMFSKVGTTYYFRLCFGDGGADVESNTTFAGTIGWAGWAGWPGTFASGSSPLFQADFLRFSPVPFTALPF